MKKVLVIIMLIFAFGCKEDVTSPNKNELVGKWKKDFVSGIKVKYDKIIIEFTNDNKVIHTAANSEVKSESLIGSYNYDNGIVILIDTDCKEVPGKYELEFRNNGVEFKLIDDECLRKEVITGFFEKYIE